MSWVKGAVGLAVAAALWMTHTFGAAWWLLLGLMAVDAAFNWRTEAAFWHKAAAQLLALGASAYVSHGLGIAAVQVVVWGLCAWEAARVIEELGALGIALQHDRKVAPMDAAALGAALSAIEAKIASIEKRAVPAAAQIPVEAAPAAAARAPGGAAGA